MESLPKLRSSSKKELLSVKGIGEKAAEEILKSVK
ncbi:MAG: hypothetical protein AB9915_04065 [Candidatus Dojkabacteria bacterium]